MSDRVSKLIPVNLMDLLTTGKMEQEFDVLGHKVKLGLLWDRESREVFKLVSGLDEMAKLPELRHQILKRSIVEIDGVDYTAPERRAIIDELLDDMDPKMKDLMFSKYNQLREQASLEFEKLLKAPKNSGSPLKQEESGRSSGDSGSTTRQIPPSEK